MLDACLGGLVLIGLGSVLAVYAVFVAGLVVAGKRHAARAFATVLPDCVVLLQRLLRDPRVPRRHKLLIGGLIPYLALPFDLVPDFIPVAGYVDDALVVAFVLARVVCGTGAAVLAEHWPGPQASLNLLLRLAGPRLR